MPSLGSGKAVYTEFIFMTGRLNKKYYPQYGCQCCNGYGNCGCSDAASTEISKRVSCCAHVSPLFFTFKCHEQRLPLSVLVIFLSLSSNVNTNPWFFDGRGQSLLDFMQLNIK
jgi:hypothetical protein